MKDVPHHNELWNHVGLPRDGNCSNIDDKQDVFSLEIQLCKGISRKTRGQKLQKRYDQRDFRSVKNKCTEWNFSPDIQVVLPARIFGDPLNRESKNVFIQFQRGRDHPDKRKQHDKRQQNQDEINKNFSGTKPMRCHKYPSPFAYSAVFTCS